MKIKFSHNYIKMPSKCEKVMLLEVFKAHKKDLHECYIEYDTAFIENEIKGNYKLPEGWVLVLLLIDDTFNIFTTIRSYNPDKEKFYKSNRGKSFKIEFAGKNENM